MPSPNPEPSSNRYRHLWTAGFILATIACGLLAFFSFLHETLYSPFGILAEGDSTPAVYMGISVYITIGVTLFTSTIIRIALDLSK